MNKHLTTKEAAAYLNVSIKTLERLRKSDDSPPYFKQGGIIRYPLDELEQWRKRHTRS